MSFIGTPETEAAACSGSLGKSIQVLRYGDQRDHANHLFIFTDSPPISHAAASLPGEIHISRSIFECGKSKNWGSANLDCYKAEFGESSGGINLFCYILYKH